MVRPYFPDIIQNCVSRINAAFSLRSQDPFQVFFEKGLLYQVRRSVYQAELNFPLVWLVFKYDETGGIMGINSEVSFEVIIAMPTDPDYTQQQREDISYKPRLLPIADQFLEELGRDRQFLTNGVKSIKYNQSILPYWGLGDVDGNNNVDNLFKNKYIDAISIVVNRLKVKSGKCTQYAYPTLNVDVYPTGGRQLVYFDDIELIVNGGLEFDPVAGESSVIIPALKFVQFEVHQRLMGQLRMLRDVEVIPDNVNGGFSLVGQKFSDADTFIVKRRPVFLP